MIAKPKPWVAPDVRRAMEEHLWNILGPLCSQHGLFRLEVLNSRRKYAPLPLIKALLTKELQRTVGYQGKGYNRVYQIFPEGRAQGWRPVSFPVLARLLGVPDHSTLVVAQQRLRERQRRKAAGGRGE